MKESTIKVYLWDHQGVVLQQNRDISAMSLRCYLVSCPLSLLKPGVH